MTIAGLTVHDDFVSPEHERALLAAVDAAPWLTSLRRRVQHYGYRYDYKARKVDRDMYLGPLPAWASSLIARLGEPTLFGCPPDQLIVNEYEPGQGISPHVDCIPCFGPVIASLSLGSSCVMELSRTDDQQVSAIFLAPRSLIVMRDDARLRWRHAIRARRSDRWNEAVHPRGRRVSLTFRTVRLER